VIARLDPECDPECVELTAEDGCLLIRPSVAPAYELEMLLRSVTPENLHGEIDQDQAVGKEAW